MRLLVFTRYPAAGRVKTRLIPALGALGARQLHRRMAEDTLGKLRGVAEIEVCFDGGNENLMREWLGEGVTYTPQGPGDLGERLRSAFSRTFAREEKPVVAVGTDCPGLKASHVEEAFRLLRRHDLVLGPAADGGYYLVGLRNEHKGIFTGIPWGTGGVLRRTREKAALGGLDTALLEELADVDRPEDLDLLDNR